MGQIHANINHEMLPLTSCPHCGISHPSLLQITDFTTQDYAKNILKWKVYRCTKCGKVVTAYAIPTNDAIIDYFPKNRTFSDSIPNPAFEFLVGAFNTLHEPSASIMMSAKAIDAMLTKIGYPGSRTESLNSRIEQAASDHEMTDNMKEWAHRIRKDANDERHPERKKEGDPAPTKEEAEETLEFAEALATYLFVLPAKIQKGLSPQINENSTEGSS